MKKISKYIIFIMFLFNIKILNVEAYYTNYGNIENKLNTLKYNIVFDLDGGVLEKASSCSNSKINITDPIKEGYDFLYYYDILTGEKVDNFNIDNLNNKIIKALYSGKKYYLNINKYLDDNLSNNNDLTFDIWINDNLISNINDYNVQVSNNDVIRIKANNITGISSTFDKTYTINNNLDIDIYWTSDLYYVDVNSIVNGEKINSGVDGFTFDVYLDNVLVADNVIDYNNKNVKYNSVVRVIANSLVGYTVNYDETKIITGKTEFTPEYSKNTYETDFYYNNTIYGRSYNKYNDVISVPEIYIWQLGYSSYFYYISGYTPWESWYQPAYTTGVNINVAEYYCDATFGSSSSSNANVQKTKMANAGYGCYVSGSMLVCRGYYHDVITAYNDAWNILPYSGSGYSRYKSMECDGGYGTSQSR